MIIDIIIKKETYIVHTYGYIHYIMAKATSLISFLDTMADILRL